MIFVFGSNEAGKHGKGAAFDALRYHGASYGQGTGRQGNSYAIPTKTKTLKPLHLEKIQSSILVFLDYAKNHPELLFNVTRIGCGLAGYSDIEIAPMFKGLTSNVIVCGRWKEILNS